jgi:prepilin-type N-terminal cleavage/methylation domain-containing protein
MKRGKMKQIKTERGRATESGFTLMEMLVAISLFVVVILAATQIFRMTIEGQRSALASQNIQENVRYFFEVMSKEVRMAQKNKSNCSSLLDSNPTPTYKVFNTAEVNGKEALYFENQYGECVVYYVNSDDVLMINRAGDEAAAMPSSLIINDLEFEVEDDEMGETHSLQPKISLVMDVSSDAAKHSSRKQIKLQTTISSRYYE